MIAYHDELSLLDKAGSQVDKGRAWRHELPLALSTSIASCRMNKLTCCHNISKWISGDLDSGGIEQFTSRVLNVPTVPTMWCEHKCSQRKQLQRPACQCFLALTFFPPSEYNTSITKCNASTAMSDGKMEWGMRSDFSLHSFSEAPYPCLMWAVYKKRDFNG